MEGRHSRDAVVGSDLSELVNVNLVELDAGVLVAELLEERRDGLAGTAPGGEEVDDDGAGGFGDLGLVVGGAVYVSFFFFPIFIFIFIFSLKIGRV